MSFECACTVPYPGRLGVVEEGALADLLMVDVNPLEKFLNPTQFPAVVFSEGRP